MIVYNNSKGTFIKKILAFLLSLVLIFGMSTPVFASENNSVQIKGLDTNYEITDYAIEIFPKHLNALINAGDLHGNIEEYSLGNSFTLFNVIQDTNSFCFPVLYKGRIVSILEIVEDKTGYNSSLSISFSKELNEIFDKKGLSDFVLLTDGIEVQAFDGVKSLVIFKLYNDGLKERKLCNYFNIPLSSLTCSLKKSDLLSDIKLSKVGKRVSPRRAPDRPASYKTLNVKGVPQSGDTCWAATCAAIINYFKGYSLNDISVAKYVFGNNWNRGGTWTDIKKAYNHWGLYPNKIGIMGFSSAKSEINAA